MEQSTTQATVGRILHAYSDRWPGPRAAIVCNAGPGWRNVNVALDGANDKDLLYRLRNASTGTTFTSVPLYDALSESQRKAALNDAPGVQVEGLPGLVKVIVEWPPR